MDPDIEKALKIRLAAGEISEDEYDRLLQKIHGENQNTANKILSGKTKNSPLSMMKAPVRGIFKAGSFAGKCMDWSQVPLFALFVTGISFLVGVLISVGFGIEFHYNSGSVPRFFILTFGVLYLFFGWIYLAAVWADILQRDREDPLFDKFSVKNAVQATLIGASGFLPWLFFLAWDYSRSWRSISVCLLVGFLFVSILGIVSISLAAFSRSTYLRLKRWAFDRNDSVDE